MNQFKFLLFVSFVFEVTTLHCSSGVVSNSDDFKKVLDNHGSMSIISHHKSGTVAAGDSYFSLGALISLFQIPNYHVFELIFLTSTYC